MAKNCKVLYDDIKLVEQECVIEAQKNQQNIQQLIIRVKYLEQQIQRLKMELQVKDSIIYKLKLKSNENDNYADSDSDSDDDDDVKPPKSVTTESVPYELD